MIDYNEDYKGTQGFCTREDAGKGNNLKSFVGGSKSWNSYPVLWKYLSHLLKLDLEGAIIFRKRVILSNKLEALVLNFFPKPPFLA